MAQYTNQAQLSYNTVVLNSNVAVGEILEVLSATKTAVTPDYGRDDDITYVISIINSGNLPFTDFSVTDNLGGYTFDGTTVYPLSYAGGSVRVYINGVLQETTPTVTAGPPMVISGLTLPANSNMTIIYEAETTQFAPLAAGGNILNTAEITGAGISTPVSANATVTPTSEPVLNIYKSIDPAVVTENGTVTYTFTIQNYGNTPAATTDNAAITDTFNPILSNISVTFNGVAGAETTDYTYDETTGLFTTTPGRITVPAATYTQDAATGAWVITPGVSTVTVTGTI